MSYVKCLREVTVELAYLLLLGSCSVSYIHALLHVNKCCCYLVNNVVPLKSYDHTCNNTLMRPRNVIDNVRVNDVISYCNNVHFDSDKIPF